MTYTEIAKTVYDKYRLAQFHDKIFNREEYEWEIGAGLAFEFPRLTGLTSHTTVKPTLYGIPVRLNYSDPNKIELWRKVKW